MTEIEERMAEVEQMLLGLYGSGFPQQEYLALTLEPIVATLRAIVAVLPK